MRPLFIPAAAAGLRHSRAPVPAGALSRREFLSRAAHAGAAAGLAITLGGCATADQPPPLSRRHWQIGCYTRPWDQHDYRVALDAIAEAGYRYAGLMTAKSPNGLVLSTASSEEEAARIGDEVRQRGLTLLSLYAGDFQAAVSLEAGIQGLRKLIANCAACGAPNLMLAGTTDPKVQTVYYQVVKACCDDAAAKGVGLSVKPHGGLNATGPQCRQTLDLVGHRNFRLWYDPGNIYYYSDGQLDPVDDAGTVDGLVVGMSVKDYLPPKEVMLTPGTGRVRFPEVMARLRQGGFRAGPLVVETLVRGELPQILAAARQARLFLENLTRPA